MGFVETFLEAIVTLYVTKDGNAIVSLSENKTVLLLIAKILQPYMTSRYVMMLGYLTYLF